MTSLLEGDFLTKQFISLISDTQTSANYHIENIACIGWHIVSLPRSITIPQMVHHREHWCPPTSSYECSWGRSTHVLPLLDIFYDITCTHGPYVVPLWTLGYVGKLYSLDAAHFGLVYVNIVFGLIDHYYQSFWPFTDLLQMLIDHFSHFGI